MIVKRVIYQEPQQQFFHDVLLNDFTEKMKSTAETFNLHPGKAEVNSWSNNAPKIKELLELSDVTDTYVTFEYLVPYNMKRIDCMIYGKDAGGQGNVVHIELKQWDNDGVKPSTSSGNFNVNEDEDADDKVYKVEAFTGGAPRIVAHPSQQVRGYNDYLTGFIEVLSEKELGLYGVAYCYNYRSNGHPNALYDPMYNDLQKEYKTYSGDEVAKLAEKIKSVLSGGDGYSIFNKMINSPIRPSKKLLESASKLVAEGNVKEFSLIEEQLVARNTILHAIRSLGKSKQKNVIIVKGGPGTGKTVIALNLLATLAGSSKRYNIHYATKSKPLLEGIKYKLPRGSNSKLLFSNVTQFIPANCEENSLDVLLVDEAHRIQQSSNTQYTSADKRTSLPMIDTLIRAAKIGVFFIDDKQGIRSAEIGSSDMIREAAGRFGATVEEVELKSQFRCNGSDNYLDWIEQVLYNEEVSARFTDEEFDFKIFDTPQALYDAIKIQNDKPGQTARLTAGFCWPWSNDLDDDGQLVKDVHIGEFAMPWETKDTIKRIPEGYVKWFEWAYKPEGIKQVGCIYTAQGFEFDYVGVIIGNDLKYSIANDCLLTDMDESKDPMLKRSRGGFDGYVRNIYRVLMSRGMKGCYVYCCNPQVAEYLKRKRVKP
jgi:DUF2075 family protein